jgi:hypothetical protein
MHELDHVALAFGRAFPGEIDEALVLERLLDRADAVRPLGMPGPGQVVEKRRMRDVKGRHDRRI